MIPESSRKLKRRSEVSGAVRYGSHIIDGITLLVLSNKNTDKERGLWSFS